MQERAARHLSEAIQIPTVSNLEDSNGEAFLRFHDWLRETYPLSHAAMERETVGDCALLYRWPGQNPALPAGVLLAHMDVVPATGDWHYPPFGGVRADGFVHGRGTLDMKGQLISIFEAAESLLAEGFVPRRDIWISLGSDEELMRTTSAAAAAELFRTRQIPLLYVLDEGIIPPAEALGLTGPVVALCGAEKGYLDLRITARGAGGHASAPPAHTALGELARAICAIENAPMPARFGEDAFTAALRDGIGAALPEGRDVMTLLQSDPRLIALTRTTIAPTMAEGSPQSNVLPVKASAILNIRIAPWDTAEAVLEHIRNTAPWVELEELHCTPPIPPADPAGYAYGHAMAAARAAFPGATVLPWCMTAATDSRYFAPLCRDVLRLTPFPHGDAAWMHAPNERILEADLRQSVSFFRLLLQENPGSAE